jgi:Fe2+ or Zn2+ uptake regulation protein
MKSKGNQSHTLLDKAGLKKTDSRTALLGFLSKNKKPLSVKDIISKLPGDKVTMYRMLEAMSKRGIVRRVDTGEREAQYEIIDLQDDHHHVICLDCKKVSDFTGCDADSVITRALKQVKDFQRITYHSFDLFGICNTCAKK